MIDMDVSEKLKKYHQEHLLAFYEKLSGEEKKKLLQQIGGIDFSLLDKVIRRHDSAMDDDIRPIGVLRHSEIQANRKRYEELGIKAIQNKKVGAVLLAGGQGSRLGVDRSKGMVDIGVTHELFIFECLFRNIKKNVDLAGTWIPFYIMTSSMNHDEIVKFLQECDYFGYNEKYISIFKQEMYPAIGYDGKILMKSKSELCMCPNGNGGWYKSMEAAGLTSKVKEDGVEWLNAFSIDNVLQQIADPCFIGAVLDKNCVSGAKVIQKADPYEKVGVMCLRNGKPSVIEYYELTDEMRTKKGQDGKYCYDFGVILNYIFHVGQLDRLLRKNARLHLADKRIQHIDCQGDTVEPAENNGYKIETLILDMVECMESCLPYEVEREKEFAPIKNRIGVDSIDTARVLLEKNGVIL